MLYRLKRWWLIRELRINDGMMATATYQYQAECARILRSNADIEKRLLRLEEANRHAVINSVMTPIERPARKVSA